MSPEKQLLCQTKSPVYFERLSISLMLNATCTLIILRGHHLGYVEEGEKPSANNLLFGGFVVMTNGDANAS